MNPWLKLGRNLLLIAAVSGAVSAGVSTLTLDFADPAIEVALAVTVVILALALAFRWGEEP